jgi:hypothetical protein
VHWDREVQLDHVLCFVRHHVPAPLSTHLVPRGEGSLSYSLTVSEGWRVSLGEVA